MIFRKGQKVTLLQNWDHLGSVRIIDLVVYSCGAKQMVLVNEDGSKFGGMNFRPGVDQFGFSKVHPRLTPDAAVAMALDLGAAIVAYRRSGLERRIAKSGKTERDGYIKACRLDLSRLHEPRIHNTMAAAQALITVAEAGR